MPSIHPVFQTKKWLEWQWNARSRYGIHSPFVYDLLTRGLQAPVPQEDDKRMRQFRRSWLQDQRKINITDPGAGSRRHRFAARKVSAMALVAGSSTEKMRLLYRLAAYFRPARVLELGTHLGIGTFALHSGWPEAQIITIEGSREIFELANEKFRQWKLPGIHSVFGLFDEVLPEVLTGRELDMIVVDGNHRYDATLRYFDLLMPALAPEGFILWDDIRWTPEMWRAWEHIRRSPQVGLSLDLYKTGLTFPGQGRRNKEHYALRYGRALSFFGLFD